MNIRLDKITVNNWSIQGKKQRERRSRCIKKNVNGVPMRSRPTRTLVIAQRRILQWTGWAVAQGHLQPDASDIS